MIFKSLRLQFGLARARRKLRRARREDAQFILVGMLNAAPDAPLLTDVYTLLAETEYQREHFRNAMHYAKLAIALLEDNPSQLGPRECDVLRAKMHWYIDSGAEQMRKARRAFVAMPSNVEIQGDIRNAQRGE